jgi:preprotein translocase subunit SecE
VVRFFRETFDELRKVDWPTPSELYRYTIIVIVTVIVMAAFIAGIDWALQQLAQRFIYGASVAGG